MNDSRVLSIRILFERENRRLLQLLVKNQDAVLVFGLVVFDFNFVAVFYEMYQFLYIVFWCMFHALVRLIKSSFLHK